MDRKVSWRILGSENKKLPTILWSSQTRTVVWVHEVHLGLLEGVEVEADKVSCLLLDVLADLAGAGQVWGVAVNGTSCLLALLLQVSAKALQKVQVRTKTTFETIHFNEAQSSKRDRIVKVHSSKDIL